MYLYKKDTHRVYNKIIKRIPSVVNCTILESPDSFESFIFAINGAYEYVIYDDLNRLLEWKKKNPKKSFYHLVAYSDILFSIEDLLTHLIKSQGENSIFSIIEICFRKSLYNYQIDKHGKEYKLTIDPKSNHKDFTDDLLEETIVRSDLNDLSIIFIDRWLEDHS